MRLLVLILVAGIVLGCSSAIPSSELPSTPYYFIDSSNELICAPHPDLVFVRDMDLDGTMDNACQWDCAICPSDWVGACSQGPGILTIIKWGATTDVGFDFRPGCE